mmetsp:Transcript_16135/g.17915  ORF Transcript_16135/g.17915 Transcript_16135/m.17915 type:complete len:87 (-) Transcript_16135:63-323(-)
MDKRIPTLKKAYNFAAHESGKGAWHRNLLMIVAGATLLWIVDKNTGFSTLGFNKTTLRNEYKFKPDYLTGTIFMANRKELPQYKYF